MEIFLAALYAGLFVLLIDRVPFFRCPGLPRWALPSLFAMKIAAGVLLSLIYTHYYPDRKMADVFKFFDDGRIMYEALFTEPADYFRMLFGIGNDTDHFSVNYYQKMESWIRPFETNIYNDSHTLIRWNAVVNLFSFGHFQVHTVFMSFFSLIGLTAMYRTLATSFSRLTLPLTFAVFMAPSVLFWGSGVMKEGLLLFAFGLLLFGFFRLARSGFSIWWALVMLGCTGLLLILKFYILLAIIPGFCAWFWADRTGNRGVPLKFGAVWAGFAALVLIFNALLPEYDIFLMLQRKQIDFNNLAQTVEAGSAVDLSTLEPTLWGLIKVAPEALMNVGFRPWPWEASSALMYLNVVENLLIWGVLLLALFKFRLPTGREANLAFFLLSFVLILFLLIGWTTPVLGALVRYKVPALPFLLAFFFLLMRPEGLPRWLRSLKPTDHD